MLKFFRKIRQKLLSDGKLARYLLYALGEIILVVIGILIALQINNWNIEKINRLEEAEYLSRMVFNLNRDLESIESSVERHEVRLIVGTEALDSLKSKNLNAIREGRVYLNTLEKHSSRTNSSPKSLGEMLWEVLRIDLFYKSDIVFQELLATGKIDIIKNQELKAAIQEHYLKITEDQNFQDRIAMTIQNNFRDALNTNNISMYSQQTFAELKDNLTDLPGLVSALENHLVISRAMLNLLTYENNSMKKSTQNLIELIESELSKSN